MIMCVAGSIGNYLQNYIEQWASRETPCICEVWVYLAIMRPPSGLLKFLLFFFFFFCLSLYSFFLAPVRRSGRYIHIRVYVRMCDTNAHTFNVHTFDIAEHPRTSKHPRPPQPLRSRFRSLVRRGKCVQGVPIGAYKKGRVDERVEKNELQRVGGEGVERRLNPPSPTNQLTTRRCSARGLNNNGCIRASLHEIAVFAPYMQQQQRCTTVELQERTRSLVERGHFFF